MLTSMLLLNEILLTRAKHLKTIVSDTDLWAMEREKVSELTDQDIVLLGASRMQVDIDLGILKKRFPGRKILQLALSGRGSSFPVFQDLVSSTGFNGVIVVDESQGSLIEGESLQQGVVDYFHRDFSFNKKANKQISMWFQQRFLFVNPNSNSERLWGNLVAKRSLPVPMLTMTYPSREQTSYFNLTDIRWIQQLRMAGVDSAVSKRPLSPEKWLSRTQHWGPSILDFKARGGRVIFIYMPLSETRWKKEDQWMPKEDYWDKAMNQFQTSSIHFADQPTLQRFRVPDTSHLDADEKGVFTEHLADILFKSINTKAL